MITSLSISNNQGSFLIELLKNKEKGVISESSNMETAHNRVLLDTLIKWGFLVLDPTVSWLDSCYQITELGERMSKILIDLKSQGVVLGQINKQGWIPVSERIPPDGQICWTFESDALVTEDGKFDFRVSAHKFHIQYHGDDRSLWEKWEAWGENLPLERGKITHWMPLEMPEPPDGSDEEKCPECSEELNEYFCSDCDTYADDGDGDELPISSDSQSLN